MPRHSKGECFSCFTINSHLKKKELQYFAKNLLREKEAISIAKFYSEHNSHPGNQFFPLFMFVTKLIQHIISIIIMHIHIV